MHNADRIDNSKRSGRNIVMSTNTAGKSPAETQLDEFRELISQYSAVAHRLMEHKRRLAAEISCERNVDRIKELELRKSTVEAERYEVLEDMRALISYVREREKCHGRG